MLKKEVVPYAEQVQRLALPGPRGEVAPKMVADMNKGFTQEELAFVQTSNCHCQLTFLANLKTAKSCQTNSG